jgi:acetylornithine deacetylase/succinyl-diaminopimelate desuccinylase-like protein
VFFPYVVQDVVTANPDSWSFDPFKLTREGDKLLGRGVTDCLGHVALLTELFRQLGLHKPPLKATVIGVFIANEENSTVGGWVCCLWVRGLEVRGGGAQCVVVWLSEGGVVCLFDRGIMSMVNWLVGYTRGQGCLGHVALLTELFRQFLSSFGSFTSRHSRQQ